MSKQFIWNAVGTTLNSFLSLFLLIIVTRCNGIEASGDFSFLFTISLMLQSFSNYGGRIYQTTDVKEEFTFNEYLSSRILLSLISVVIYAILCIIYGFKYNIILIGILLVLFRIIETVSDVIYGSLQKKHKLDIVGKSLTIKSIFILILFSITNFISKNLLYSTISLLIAGIIIFLIYDFKNIINYKFKLNYEIYKKSFSIFISGFVTLLILNIPRFISEITLKDNELGYLGILLMIPTIMSLVCQFLLQPQIINLSEKYKNLDLKEFKKCYRRINAAILLFSIFCTICAIALGNPILTLLYGIPFDKYILGFCILILSGTFNGISIVYSNLFVIIRKSKLQLAPFTITLLVSPIVVLYLSQKLGLYGVFYSLLITMFIQTMIFIIINNKILKKAFK